MKNDMSKIITELMNEGDLASGIMSIGGQATVEEPTVTLPTETNLEENEEIKLSPKSIRTLFVSHIAEQLVNEEVNEDEDLNKYGLMCEGKLTLKGKEWIKKFLPTIYAS